MPLNVELSSFFLALPFPYLRQLSKKFFSLNFSNTFRFFSPTSLLSVAPKRILRSVFFSSLCVWQFFFQLFLDSILFKSYSVVFFVLTLSSITFSSSKKCGREFGHFTIDQTIFLHKQILLAIPCSSTLLYSATIFQQGFSPFQELS